ERPHETALPVLTRKRGRHPRHPHLPGKRQARHRSACAATVAGERSSHSEISIDLEEESRYEAAAAGGGGGVLELDFGVGGEAGLIAVGVLDGRHGAIGDELRGAVYALAAGPAV